MPILAVCVGRGAQSRTWGDPQDHLGGCFLPEDQDPLPQRCLSTECLRDFLPSGRRGPADSTRCFFGRWRWGSPRSSSAWEPIPIPTPQVSFGCPLGAPLWGCTHRSPTVATATRQAGPREQWAGHLQSYWMCPPRTPEQLQLGRDTCLP